MDFFLGAFFDHLIVNDHHGTRFAKIHTFGFDNFIFPFVRIQFGKILDILEQTFTAIFFTIRTGTHKYEFPELSHVSLKV